MRMPCRAQNEPCVSTATASIGRIVLERACSDVEIEDVEGLLHAFDACLRRLNWPPWFVLEQVNILLRAAQTPFNKTGFTAVMSP
jgi:hypothetical protein